MNREEWLTAAVKPLAARINASSKLKCHGDIAVTCGWPRQDQNGKVIGQCFPQHSGKGKNQLFISPLLDSPIQVLATLLHEMLHAADDCKHAHKAVFSKAAKAVGLYGKPTATYCLEDTELHYFLECLADALGPYPHSAMSSASHVLKKQTTRMLKCECDDCGYIVRTTKKWLEIATPLCPLESCPNYSMQLTVEDRESE